MARGRQAGTTMTGGCACGAGPRASAWPTTPGRRRRSLGLRGRRDHHMAAEASELSLVKAHPSSVGESANT